MPSTTTVSSAEGSAMPSPSAAPLVSRCLMLPHWPIHQAVTASSSTEAVKKKLRPSSAPEAL